MPPKISTPPRRALGLALLALQLLGLPCAATAEIIVDNASSSGVAITGAWTTASIAQGAYDVTYLHDQSSGKGSKSVRYTPNITAAGDYEVFLRWTSGDNRPMNVPVTITSAAGSTTVPVDQRKNGGKWYSLGVFPFAAGTSGNILVGTANTEGYYVIADAVRLVPADLAEVVVDNDDAGATTTGAWTASSLSGQRYGADYLHDAGDKTSVKTVRFTPDIPATGLYEISAWWSASDNRPDNTPLRVNSAAGPENFLADQTRHGGRWNSLGVFPMMAGTLNDVLLSNAGTASGTAVIADAIKFTQRPDIEVIVDDADSAGVTLTGTWPSSSQQSDRYGTSYLHDQNADKGLKSVRFTPTLPEPGSYEVYLYWSGGGTRSRTTPVTVTWAGGVTQVPVDQRYNGGKWNSIGTYNFLAGDFGHVEIGNAETTGHVIADAVRFVRRAKLWTPEDLGDQLWMYWSADSLPDGTITSWIDKRRGVTATAPSGLEPSKSDDEVLFASGAKRLHFAKQNTAHITNRAVMVLFRADLAGTTDSRSIFAVNGVGGGNANRQPYVSMIPKSDKIGVTWKTANGSNALAFSAPVDKTKWHCLVSRRTQDFHYASLDGKQVDGSTPGESSVAMADWGMEKNPFTDGSDPASTVKGYIGKHDSAPELAIDSIVVVQGELGKDDADRLMGWGMWKRGAQSQLPAGHPYRHHPPYVPIPLYQFEESTPAEYQAIAAPFDTAAAESHIYTPVNLSGWNLVFSDDFNSHSVTDEGHGRGPWFAPVHPEATGDAVGVNPVATTNPNVKGSPGTYILDPSAGTMTLRMQKDGSTWKSGAICSMNTSGYGQSWLYPYVEVRMKTGPSSTNNWKGAWPAIWLESINYFNNRAESYVEYDIYEGYISDPTAFHNSYHNHAADFVQSGRLKSDRWVSHYFGLHNHWHDKTVNLFDNQYHTYAAMVTPDLVITYFDGKEIHRFPTPKEMHQPLWLLVDLAMHRDEDHLAGGVYNLEIDYVKVYQNPDYLP